MFNGYAWVTSHTCVSHVTDSYAWHVAFEWFVSRVSLWVVSHTYVCHVTWLIRTRAVTHLNDSVVFTSHTTDERELRYTYAWVMLRLFINHVTHMNKDECVIFFFCSLVWSAAVQKNRQTWLIYHMIDLSNLWYTCLMNESCHAWVMSNTCVGHVTWPWLIYTSNVTHFSLISVVST